MAYGTGKRSTRTILPGINPSDRDSPQDDRFRLVPWRSMVLALTLAFFCAGPAFSTDSPEAKDIKVAPAGTQKTPRPPKTWRAFIEEAVLFTASTIDYWGSYDEFTIDWQFTWKTFGRKLFTAESPKMDSNAFWFNWSHAGAGAGYYCMARTNGLNSRVSFLFSFGTSALWETLSEWRELISINDMIFTGFGGPAIGEPLFQVSSYFSHRKGFGNALAGFLSNPFLFVNNWFDRRSGPAANSGPPPGTHRFHLFAGMRDGKIAPAETTAVDRAGAYHQFSLGLDLQTDTLPGSGGSERPRKFYADTLSSRVFLEMSFSAAGLEEVEIRTSASLFGWIWPRLHRNGEGELRGHSLAVGYGTAFELFKKRSVAWYDSIRELEDGSHASTGQARLERPTPTRFTDKQSVVSPLGGIISLDDFGPRRSLRWTSGVFADFALCNALAYNRYTESHDPGGVKTTLLNWGYYYAFGITLSSDVAVDWRPWRLRGAASYQRHDSIQGLDRYQYLGDISDDFKLRDTRWVWQLSLGYRWPGTPVELELATEGVSRRGRLLELREQYSECRCFYRIGLVF